MHHYDPVYISASDSKYQVVIGDQVGPWKNWKISSCTRIQSLSKSKKSDYAKIKPISVSDRDADYAVIF